MSKQPHLFLDPANFWPYTLYIVLISIFSAALLEMLKSIVGSSTGSSMAVTALVCFSLTFGCWVLCRHYFAKRLVNGKLTIVRIQHEQPVSAQALIALCSQSSKEQYHKNAAFEAAQYHRATLHHIWLITSHSGEETARWVNEQLRSWGVQVHQPIILEDTCEVDLIRLRVEEVRRQAIEGYRVPETDVICDFTGMTKPVTAGMILACAPKGRRLEYLQGQYDSDGKLVRDAASVPVEIEIQYQIEPEL